MKIIRLTESDLHRLVKESVRRVLAETDASAAGVVAAGVVVATPGTAVPAAGVPAAVGVAVAAGCVPACFLAACAAQGSLTDVFIGVPLATWLAIFV